jgi:hypothetical protein
MIRAVVGVHLLLHRGRVGQAGVDVNTPEPTLVEQVPPNANGAVT